jgi:antitoxin (DNA-binding transcriptional repressor) of toxin-antitoxin stability system
MRVNLQHRRKTLIFVVQTGTRDIRDRFSKVLHELAPGGNATLVEVGILSASDMSPAKREAWIKANTPSMDALLINPKLVETRLDLVMFSDLVFYETTTSLDVLWQSMRRVWRLGQEKDVKVTFLAYSGTVEEQILARMGQKMKFAQLLYGKEASGTLIEVDQDDIQREIIQAALEGKAYKNAGDAVRANQPACPLSIFGNPSDKTMRINLTATGSPIATSPVIVPAGPTAMFTKVEQVGSLEVVQLTMFGFEAVQITKPKRRH